MPSPLQAQIFKAGRVITLDWTAGKAVAFCALARPQQFFAGLKARGQEIAGQLAFRDHHRYRQADIDRLLQLKRSTGADSFITTEKDLINLGPLAAQLQPLRTAQLQLKLENPDQALVLVLETIEHRSGCRL
jgi:tetraacyldisaccharide 4'-kinase